MIETGLLRQSRFCIPVVSVFFPEEPVDFHNRACQNMNAESGGLRTAKETEEPI